MDCFAGENRPARHHPLIRVAMASVKSSAQPSAFTLLEVLVSVSVLALMMTIIAQMIVGTQNTVSKANSHIHEHQEARRALGVISASLSQAAMDAVWDYRRDSTDPTSITGYERSSSHHFILGPASDLIKQNGEAGQAVFFQAPLGRSQDNGTRQLHHLVNCCGFFVAYGSDLPFRPDFMKENAGTVINPERKRFRLMHYLQPAEKSILYSGASNLNLNQLSGRSQALRWYQDDLHMVSRPLADNVIALILVPHGIQASAGPDGSTATNVVITPDRYYQYDSRDFQWNGLNTQSKPRRHQLPAKVTVILIVTDERSYDALESKLGAEAAAGRVRGVFEQRFKDYQNHAEDLAAVETALGALPLHHKILSTTVSLRNSKWISEYDLQ